jgi:hypothetical protein
MRQSFVRNNLLMFCLGRGWTPRDELYGITNESIDPDFGLYEPISIPKASSLDLQMCMIPSCQRLEHWSFFCDREMQIPSSSWNCSLGFWGDTIFASPLSCGSLPSVIIFWCFVWGHGCTLRDELYGITNQSIDPDLGLYESISIPKVSTFDLQVCKIPSCHCSEHQLLVCEKQMLIPSSSCKLFVRFLGSNNFMVRLKNITIFCPQCSCVVLFWAWVDSSWWVA